MSTTQQAVNTVGRFAAYVRRQFPELPRLGAEGLVRAAFWSIVPVLRAQAALGAKKPRLTITGFGAFYLLQRKIARPILDPSDPRARTTVEWRLVFKGSREVQQNLKDLPLTK